MQEIIKQLTDVKSKPRPFDLEIWLLEQRLKTAQANTDELFKELRK